MPGREVRELWPPAVVTAEEQAVLHEVLKALRQVRYGSITIIVQDRRVVQIDRTEKTRLGKETET